MKKLSAMICVLALILAQAAPAGGEQIDFATYSGTNAAFRSLVLPGWGQWYNSQNFKAYLLGGLVLCGAGATCYYYDKANKTYSDYERTGVANDPLYDEYEKQINQASSYAYITAGLWIIGVVDAYFVADKNVRKNKQGLRNKEEGIALAQDVYGVRLLYRTKF